MASKTASNNTTDPIKLEDFDLSHQLNWKRDFPIIGGGTVNFNVQRCTPFWIVIRPKEKLSSSADQWIALNIGKDIACFKLRSGKQTNILAEKRGKSERGVTVGYEEGSRISYWLSYNCNLLVLKYGKGYQMVETTIMEHDFLKGLSPHEQKKTRTDLHKLFSPEVPKVIEQYDCIPPQFFVQEYASKLAKGMTFGNKGKQKLPLLCEHGNTTFTLNPAEKSKLDTEAKDTAEALLNIDGHVDFINLPFTCNWPPVVLDSSKSTLFELDSNNYTLSASLPAACQELYQNIAPDRVSLDWTPGNEKYKLSDAIRHSLDSKDGILRKKLMEKARDFGGKNESKTYLRVTLGNDHGHSPGIPYVLEIWPKGHSSPIHSHGGSYAVIKVLHGGLTVYIYNKHTECDSEPELLNFDVKQRDVTWISPNWYQTHKLWNKTDDFCATIQCYKYGEHDYQRCPYFEYIKNEHEVGEFVPCSDFTFRELREKVLKEYEDHINNS